MEENANTQEENNNKEEDNKEQKKKEIFSKLIVSNDNFKELYKIVNSDANYKEKQNFLNEYRPSEDRLFRMFSSPSIKEDIKRFNKIKIENTQTKKKYKAIMDEIYNFYTLSSKRKDTSSSRRVLKYEPIKMMKKNNTKQSLYSNQMEIIPQKEKSKLFSKLRLSSKDWSSLDNVKKDTFYINKSKEVKRLVLNTNGTEVKNYNFNIYSPSRITDSSLSNTYSEELTNFTEMLHSDKREKIKIGKTQSIFDDKKNKFKGVIKKDKKEQLKRLCLDKLKNWD